MNQLPKERVPRLHSEPLTRRSDVRRLLVLLVAAGGLIIASVMLGDQLKDHIGALHVWIGSLGFWGVLVFAAALVVGTSVLLPESLFGVAAGVLFGLVWGIAIAVLANALAAAFQYALARWLFRHPVQRIIDRRPSLVAIQHAVMKDQLRLQFLLRLTPLNPATVSYLLGSANVRFSTFMMACLGLLPHVCLEVYLGHAGAHLVEASAATARAAHGQQVVLIGGLVMGVLAIVVIARIARRAVLSAVASEESA